MPSLVTPVRAGAGALFGSLARITGSRPLHPLGVAFAATLTVDEEALPGTRLFGRAAVWEARIRFSRGFGIPDPLPEILSVAVKVPDAYGAGRDHDLLLTATGRHPLVRHLFVPGRSHLGCFYSSVLPFRAGDETVFFGAAPRSEPPAGGDLDQLTALAAREALELDLLVATALSPWRRIGSVRAGRRLSDAEESALAFNSDSTGGGIAPSGAINHVRGGAYAAAGHARRLGSGSATRPQRARSRARSR